MNDRINLWLAGDVMTGRGIDQTRARASDPTLHEDGVQDARVYMQLAERMHGVIPAPVNSHYVWGDALQEVLVRRPHAAIVNLETAVTLSDTPWPDKPAHYRMHPDNLDTLLAAGVNVCTLANNHVLDWGTKGLRDTLAHLRHAGLGSAGAGLDGASACAPAIVPLAHGRRLLVFAWACRSSGVPDSWRAMEHRPGVALLDELDDEAAHHVAACVFAARRAGDRVVVSLHWGANWEERLPDAHRRFARRLIDLDAADVVHGHSSHHPMPLEVYHGRLILYGCGDLINDYEGIADTQPIRDETMCLYFAQIDAHTGSLLDLGLRPMRMRRFRLESPATDAPFAAAAAAAANGSAWHADPDAAAAPPLQLQLMPY